MIRYSQGKGVVMKIKIEFDEQLQEEEVIIRANSLNQKVLDIQEALYDLSKQQQKIVFYQNNSAYYLSLEEILFFETDGKEIHAHTINQMYSIKYRLYELEEMLPGYFMRVSKSTILNIKRIYAITRSLPSSCSVQFQNTHKQVYVSRYYYKPLKSRLEEKR